MKNAHLAVEAAIVACRLETGQHIIGADVGIFLWSTLKSEMFTRSKRDKIETIWLGNIPIRYEAALGGFEISLMATSSAPNPWSQAIRYPRIESTHKYDLAESLLPLYMDENDNEQSSSDSN